MVSSSSAPSTWQKVVGVLRSLMGVSVYETPANDILGGVTIDSPSVESTRKATGGILQSPPVTQLRWYLADLELAQAEADAGNLTRASQLYRAMRRDGVLAGLLSTRTSGLVRLPKRFYGERTIVSDLCAKNGTRSTFDEMCPPSELAAIEADGDVIGVGLGELCPVVGRDYPVLVRLDPEWLTYRWDRGGWYYASRAGLLPVTPGDGRWVLHIPGGRVAPWNWGLWPALGRAFILKEHALSLRGAFIAGVANPAKVLESPLGANDQFKAALFSHVMNWGPNMAVELPAGWKLSLLEMVGRAYEVFQREIDTSDMAYMVAIAGQIVTTTGGKGFDGGDMGRIIRGDLITASGESLSYTVNTQVLPQFIARRYGVEAVLNSGVCMDWNTDQPKDLEGQTRTLGGAGGAIKALNEAAQPYGRQIDLDQIAARFGIPFRDGTTASSQGVSTGDDARQPTAAKGRPTLELMPQNENEEAA